MKLSLIIPAYNEEKRIESTLQSYNNYFKDYFDHYELIVVCDGCTDNTADIVRIYAKRYEQIRLLEYDRKLGKGGGLIKGFQHADGDIIGFTDADGATTPDQFRTLIEALSSTTDVAIGSRKMEQSEIIIHQSLGRELVSKAFNLLIRIMFGLQVSDSQCGAKVFKKHSLHSILPHLVTRGFEIDVELLYRAKKQGYTITEVPIKWEHKEDTVFSFSFIPEMFIGLLKIRFIHAH